MTCLNDFFGGPTVWGEALVLMGSVSEASTLCRLRSTVLECNAKLRALVAVRKHQVLFQLLATRLTGGAGAHNPTPTPYAAATAATATTTAIRGQSAHTLSVQVYRPMLEASSALLEERGQRLERLLTGLLLSLKSAASRLRQYGDHNLSIAHELQAVHMHAHAHALQDGHGGGGGVGGVGAKKAQLAALEHSLCCKGAHVLTYSPSSPLTL